MFPKAWGTKNPRYTDEFTEVVDIEIVKGGFSSRHLHDHKYNYFIVKVGVLRVVTYDAQGNRGRAAILRAESPGWRVHPGVFHRFEALSNVVATEIYWSSDGTPIDPEDIVRSDVGGIKEA